MASLNYAHAIDGCLQLAPHKVLRWQMTFNLIQFSNLSSHKEASTDLHSGYAKMNIAQSDRENRHVRKLMEHTLVSTVKKDRSGPEKALGRRRGAKGEEDAGVKGPRPVSLRRKSVRRSF